SSGTSSDARTVRWGSSCLRKNRAPRRSKSFAASKRFVKAKRAGNVDFRNGAVSASRVERIRAIPACARPGRNVTSAPELLQFRHDGVLLPFDEQLGVGAIARIEFDLSVAVI